MATNCQQLPQRNKNKKLQCVHVANERTNKGWQTGKGDCRHRKDASNLPQLLNRSPTPSKLNIASRFAHRKYSLDTPARCGSSLLFTHSESYLYTNITMYARYRSFELLRAVVQASVWISRGVTHQKCYTVITMKECWPIETNKNLLQHDVWRIVW